MTPDDAPLNEEERAELERLRAEKATQQKAARAAQERAELERLKVDKLRSKQEAAAIAHEQEQRERGRKLMQPDEDDLKMPVGQKIVLAALAVLVVAVIASMFM
jgi:Flp pilus assembly protein TadB